MKSNFLQFSRIFPICSELSLFSRLSAKTAKTAKIDFRVFLRFLQVIADFRSFFVNFAVLANFCVFQGNLIKMFSVLKK